jgi:DNA-binding transcriptional ArsR family regulator
MTHAQRKPFLTRQEKEKEILLGLYNSCPQVNTEYRFMAAGKLANIIGVGPQTVDRALRTFESLGILTRRLEFGAINSKGQTIPGRSYHWTLIMGLKAASNALEEFHNKEIREAKEPSPWGTSTKARIMIALRKQSKFDTMDDLARAVRKPGENLDYHNLTHVMESLAREGKISFDRGKTKDRIPFNIRLTKNGAKTEEVVVPVIMPEDIVIEDIPAPIEDNEEPVPLARFVDVSAVLTSDEYPTITRLIRRREWLETAARLAEDAEEDDVAITLLDRANKPLTPLEMEAIRLFEAYKNK